VTAPATTHTRRVHELRAGFHHVPAMPHVTGLDEVTKAWRRMQLGYLAHLPGYRALVKARISAVVRERTAGYEPRVVLRCVNCGAWLGEDGNPTRRFCSERCRKTNWDRISRVRQDVDNLGREPDGCG